MTVSRKIKRNRHDHSLHKLREDIAGIDAKDTGQVNELDDIHTPLAALNPGYHGLRGFESSGDLRLGKLGGLAGRQKSRAQRSMTTRSKSLQRECSH
jgi:hypothetical protein